MAVVIMPKFGWPGFLESVRRHKITHLLLVSLDFLSLKNYLNITCKGCSAYGRSALQGTVHIVVLG